MSPECGMSLQTEITDCIPNQTNGFYMNGKTWLKWFKVLEYLFFLKSKNTVFLHKTMEKPYFT